MSNTEPEWLFPFDVMGVGHGTVEGLGWADLSHKSVVEVSGPDRLSWLQAITTQDVENLEKGKWAEVLILDAMGHINHQFLFFEIKVNDQVL